jgi:hypothetical protein
MPERYIMIIETNPTNAARFDANASPNNKAMSDVTASEPAHSPPHLKMYMSM